MTPDQMEDQQNIDSMLLLEGKLQERVNKLIGTTVERTIVNIIGKQIQEAIKREKEEMLLEIAIKVGQMLKNVDKDERKALWEYTPDELKIPEDMLKPHDRLSPQQIAQIIGNEDDETP